MLPRTPHLQHRREKALRTTTALPLRGPTALTDPCSRLLQAEEDAALVWPFLERVDRVAQQQAAAAPAAAVAAPGEAGSAPGGGSDDVDERCWQAVLHEAAGLVTPSVGKVCSCCDGARACAVAGSGRHPLGKPLGAAVHGYCLAPRLRTAAGPAHDGRAARAAQ